MATKTKLPKLLGVVGSGQMGTGIAQVAAVKGLDVLLIDADARALDRARANLSRALDRLVGREALTRGDADKALERVRTDSDIEALHASDFIVEAVNESEPLKKSIFSMLDRVAPPGATLASNTSSISITRIAAATARPQCVVGMHFMNPVPAMPLVELVKGIATSDRAAAEATALAEHLGKTLIASLDRPGFLVNRCLMPMINEAFYCLMEGVGTAEDIDKGMKFGTHHPMGPLLLADYIGLDTVAAILRVMQSGTGDPKFAPCPLLVQMVDAGWLGKKAFRGVYHYAEPLN